MNHIWRVGNHQPQSLYRGDEYMGVMFNPVVAEFVCEAMNGKAVAADSDTETRTDHTPVTVAQEVQKALVSTGLDIRAVTVNTYIVVGYAHASILMVGARHYATDESDRLAHYLGLDVAYSERGKPDARIATLNGKTRTGLSVTIYCEPRMTAEEVQQEHEAKP